MISKISEITKILKIQDDPDDVVDALCLAKRIVDQKNQLQTMLEDSKKV